MTSPPPAPPAESDALRFFEGASMLVEVLEGRWTEVEVDADADEGPGGGLGRRVVVAEEAIFWPAGRSWSAKVRTELKLRVGDDERVGA